MLIVTLAVEAGREPLQSGALTLVTVRSFLESFYTGRCQPIGQTFFKLNKYEEVRFYNSF